MGDGDNFGFFCFYSRVFLGVLGWVFLGVLSWSREDRLI